MHATETYYQQRIAELERELQFSDECYRMMEQIAELRRLQLDAAYAHGVNDERKKAAERVRAEFECILAESTNEWGCVCNRCEARRVRVINAAGGVE